MIFSPTHGLCSDAEVRAVYPNLSLPEELHPALLPDTWFPVVVEDAPDYYAIPQYRFENRKLIIGWSARPAPRGLLEHLRSQIQHALRSGISREAIVTLLD